MLISLTRTVWSNYQVWEWSNCCKHFSIGTWHSSGPSTGLPQADIKLFPQRQCPALSWHTLRQQTGPIGEHCRAGEGRSWPLCQVNKCPLPRQCVSVLSLLGWLSQSRVSFGIVTVPLRAGRPRAFPLGRRPARCTKQVQGSWLEPWKAPGVWWQPACSLLGSESVLPSSWGQVKRGCGLGDSCLEHCLRYWSPSALQTGASGAVSSTRRSRAPAARSSARRATIYSLSFRRRSHSITGLHFW